MPYDLPEMERLAVLVYSRFNLAVNLSQFRPYRTKLIKVIKATKRSTAKLVKLRSKIISIKTPAR